MTTANDVSAWMWLLWADSGHAACTGWTYETRDRRLVCSCGRTLFRLGLVKS